MKNFILLAFSMFFFAFISKAQEKKDTLFFSFDKHYTILSNNTSWSYSDWIKITKEQMDQTKTNGYVVVSHGSPVKDLKPKKVLSIKEYIESRKFYFDGKYNNIVDKRKLKNILTDKYIIFFVKENEYIEAKNLEYVSFYPRRDKDWYVIQNPIKDTLFFKIDNNKYVYEDKLFPEEYFVREKSTEGGFFLKEIKKYGDLKKKDILNLKEFIQSSEMYNKRNKMFNTHELSEYLSNYVVFLLKKENNETRYIEVLPGYAVE